MNPSSKHSPTLTTVSHYTMDISASDLLAERIENTVVHNPHFDHTKMLLKMKEGKVVLEGKVNTFFEKQMVQEALKHVDGIDAIYNHLEVTWN